jgi:corrinoid protein of di/trimethylamine methyltransferase
MEREKKAEAFSEQARQVIINGDRAEAVGLAQQAVKSGIEPLKAVDAFTEGIKIVGDMFSDGDCYLPELICSGEAMKDAMEILDSEIQKRGEERKYIGTVVIGTVKDDIHDIGKTIVTSLLGANGFHVYDLGTDVSAETFIEKIEEVNANIVALSALITTTMPYQGKVIKAIIDAGLRDKVKIIIGGAPTSESWSEQIGADGYGKNAINALEVSKKLMQDVSI